jgi:competence protein ComGC
VSLKRTLAIVVLLSLALVALLGVVPAVQDARRAAAESGLRSLLVQAEQQLAAYHAKHGEYPESLAGFKFVFDEGTDAATLERMTYRTDGKYYRLVIASDWDGSELSVCH